MSTFGKLKILGSLGPAKKDDLRKWCFKIGLESRLSHDHWSDRHRLESRVQRFISRSTLEDFKVVNCHWELILVPSLIIFW